MPNSGDGDMSGPELNIVIRNLQPGSYTWSIILYVVLFLTVPGAILACLGYNDVLNRICGHIGLASLIIGSLICSCAFAYLIWCKKEQVESIYQSLPNVDLPTTSDSDNPVSQLENRLLRELQSEEPSTSDQDSGRADQVAAGGSSETSQLLHRAADILGTQPSSSSSPPEQSSESESARQSKSSLYVSTEMPPNESNNDSATESEAKSLMSQTDTKLQAQFEATI